MMGGIFSPDNVRQHGADTVDLACPECGSSEIKILRLPPENGIWPGGRAACKWCGVQFSIQYVLDSL
jgi:hypothetical protein